MDRKNRAVIFSTWQFVRLKCILITFQHSSSWILLSVSIIHIFSSPEIRIKPISLSFRALISFVRPLYIGLTKSRLLSGPAEPVGSVGSGTDQFSANLDFFRKRNVICFQASLHRNGNLEIYSTMIRLAVFWTLSLYVTNFEVAAHICELWMMLCLG